MSGLTGRVADFALPVDRVKDASVAMTIFNGRVVYERDPMGR